MARPLQEKCPTSMSPVPSLLWGMATRGLLHVTGYGHHSVPRRPLTGLPGPRGRQESNGEPNPAPDPRAGGDSKARLPALGPAARLSRGTAAAAPPAARSAPSQTGSQSPSPGFAGVGDGDGAVTPLSIQQPGTAIGSSVREAPVSFPHRGGPKPTLQIPPAGWFLQQEKGRALLSQTPQAPEPKMPFPGSAKDEAPELQPLPPRERSQDYSGGAQGCSKCRCFNSQR